MFQLQSETRGEQTSLVDEMVGNQKIVQAFGHEQEALERFDEINGRLEKASLRAIFIQVQQTHPPVLLTVWSMRGLVSQERYLRFRDV